MGQSSNIRFSKKQLLNNYWGFVEETIRKFGSKEFVASKNGSLTFLEANTKANLVFHYIQNISTSKSTGIGIFLRDPLEIVPCMMGVLKDNDYFVVLDVTFPEETLRSMIEDASIKIILTSSRYINNIRPIIDDSISIINIDQFDTSLNIVDPVVTFSPEDIVQIMFTSGSTGKPKGAIEDYRYLTRAVFAKTEVLNYEDTDRILRLSSFTFSGPHVDVFIALVIGLSLSYHDVKVEGLNNLSEWMMQDGATFYSSTATTYRSLIKVLRPEDVFPSFRLIILAGEKRLKSDLVSIKKHFPNVKYIRLGFAGTETSFVCSSIVPLDVALNYELLPSGKPHSDLQVIIWDPEGNTLPQGQEGEIVVHGDSIARGYINEPELTKNKFIQDKINTGWQYYRTGDLGKILPDGQLMHLGRLDNMIKIKGIRIELESIENLITSYPGVILVASKVFTDEKGTKKLAVYFTSEDEVALSITDLRKYLAEHLPSQQLPSYLIWLKSMPVTNSGKISLEKLPPPKMIRPDLLYPYVAPSTITENKLVAIWEEQIGISGIGVKDDFFDVGGDSLIGVIIFVAIEEVFGKVLPISTLLRAPNIRELSKIIDGTVEIMPNSPVIAINQKGNKFPLFFIPGKGGFPTRVRHLAKKLDQEIPVYAFQNTVDGQKNKFSANVENQAKQFLNEIRKIYPKGPIILAGESLGGKIAYEIAQQMLNRGENPPLIFLLDTYLSEISISESRRVRNKLPYFKMLVKKHINIWINSTWEGKKDYLNFYRETFNEKASRFLRHRISGLYKVTKSAIPDKYSQIEIRNIEASLAYKARPYPAQVILVMALRGIVSNVPAHGWDKVGIKELKIEELDCYHGSILFEPAVSELAKIIQSYVSNAEKKTT
jgi:acyl-coenzyme A synthetase/AMP-(fatty) acid ligase/thioesterase domain-containing protein/acyl carrier protein